MALLHKNPPPQAEWAKEADDASNSPLALL